MSKIIKLIVTFFLNLRYNKKILINANNYQDKSKGNS